MVQMTTAVSELLNTALADGTPCLVGTATKDGHPQISPKGSVAMFDEKTLCFWERSHRSVEKNLAENSYVVVYYRNAARAKEIPGGTLRFHGKARVVTSGPERDRAWDLTIPAEQEKDPEKKGAAVLIDLDYVEQLNGTVVMKRD